VTLFYIPLYYFNLSIANNYICFFQVLKTELQEVIWGGGDELAISSLEQGQVTGCCKCGNEYKVSIKCGQFLVSENLLGSQEVLCSSDLLLLLSLITFMQDIYNYIPKTNHVSRV
jgi:hypothetical protein